jgi:hypothetical protein
MIMLGSEYHQGMDREMARGEIRSSHHGWNAGEEDDVISTFSIAQMF